jgi:hypothetical protein
MAVRDDTTFVVGGAELAAWFYPPAAPSPVRPCVVMGQPFRRAARLACPIWVGASDRDTIRLRSCHGSASPAPDQSPYVLAMISRWISLAPP